MLDLFEVLHRLACCNFQPELWNRFHPTDIHKLQHFGFLEVSTARVRQATSQASSSRVPGSVDLDFHARSFVGLEHLFFSMLMLMLMLMLLLLMMMMMLLLLLMMMMMMMMMF